MKLKRVRITNYRSIEDSDWVEIGDITCLVGKNESGKTGFLQALRTLKPTSGPATFDETMDYPSRHYAAYKRTRQTDPADVIEAVFELEADELGRIEQSYGKGVLTSAEITVRKGYGPMTYYTSLRDETKAVKHLTKGIVLPEPAKAQVAGAATVAELHELLSGVAEPDATVTALVTKLEGFRDNDFDKELVDRFLAPWLPRFFYFDDYSIMRGRVSVPHLQARKAAGTLEPDEETFLALLDLVDADLDDYAKEQNFERLTRELEAAANGISAEVFRFWTQNRDLRVNIQMSQANPTDDPPLDAGPILNVRISNQRHLVTVPFDERSRGFVWFFSFLAYFSQLEREDGDLILLLDEPGLNLHATAQADLLRFIDERLAPDHQVIYTTHSPFMVEAGRLERVRTVTDVPDEGTKISSEVFRTDSETVFPLQAALGYDLAQTLFVGPDCLLVEGPSDLIYIQLLTEALRAQGREGLDGRWVVVPVGGADKLSTFVSLLGGNQLNVVALMDVSRKDQQRITNLQTNGYLGKQALVQVGEFTGSKDADIEDIFDPGFYLELVNGAYAGDLTKKLTATALGKGNPRIAVRVEEYFKQEAINGGSFSHYPPSAHFLREQAKLLPKLDEATLARAEALFKRVNALLA